jgi:hypothetical protein
MSEDICAAKIAEHVARFYCQPFTAEDAMALLEKQCGRFVRGKSVGKLRGWATITICTHGGWKRNGYGEGNGRVCLPGSILGVVITDFNGKVFLSVGDNA